VDAAAGDGKGWVDEVSGDGERLAGRSSRWRGMTAGPHGRRRGRAGFFVNLGMDTLIYGRSYATHDLLFKDYRQAFDKAGIKVRFPIAHEVLFDLVDRMDLIYRGMLDVAHRDNLYSAYIQYRSLIEHYILIQYIVDKTATDQSDETAERYQKHLFISEVLAEQMGALHMEDLLNAVETQTEFLDYLHSRFPEMAEFDKENQREISAAIRQFSRTAMVKHLTDRYARLPGNPGGGRVFAFTLPEFSQVSTFTHAGAYAGQLLKSLTKDRQVEEQLRNKLHIGLTMLGVCKENAFYVYEIDPSFMTIHAELQKARTIAEVSPEVTSEK
jgi:hypothetical protein